MSLRSGAGRSATGLQIDRITDEHLMKLVLV